MSILQRERITVIAAFFCLLALSMACRHSSAQISAFPDDKSAVAVTSPIIKQLIDAAIEQTNYTKGYDPAYTKMAYPNGDVPIETGVCSDVIVRAFRKVSVDLQKEVHEDMARNFAAYPSKWRLTKTDSNIDHRRVPNLMTYFKRQGKALAVTSDAKDYQPGDIVAWDLGGGLTHIGLMTNIQGDGGGYKIVHNIGGGARIEDRLFEWRIIGHYRYF